MSSDEMRSSPLNAVEYVKWPRLLVVGEPVTHEQANEIIVRTTRLYYIGTNDKEWERLVSGALGVRPNLGLTIDDYRDGVTDEQRIAKIELREANVESREKALRTLDLHYLACDERIASAYVDGPHGWCDWDGTVGSATYNIGKWPTAVEVDCDLRSLAAAFPFLRMRVQVLNDRYYENVKDTDGVGTYLYDTTAPVTWTVANGEVTYEITDNTPITPPTEPNFEDMASSFFAPGRERGVTIERLREAVAQVERAYAPPTNDEENEDGDE